MANLHVFTKEEVEEMNRLHWEEGLSILDLANKYDCNHGKITKAFNKYGFKRMSASEIKKIVMNRDDVLANVSAASKKSSPHRKATNIIKYGAAVAANGKEVKEKWQGEMLEKEGILWGNQRPENRENMKDDNNPAKRDEVREKIKEKHWTKKSDEEVKEVQDKQKATNIYHWDVDNPMKSDIIKDRVRKTCNGLEGVDWPTQLDGVQDKIQNTRIENSREFYLAKARDFGIEVIGEFQDTISDIEVKCLKCSNIFTTHLTYIFHGYGKCTACFPPQCSTPETYLREFILSLFDEKDVIFNDRKFLNNNKEIDILIPSKNVGIELDGLYYHSEAKGKLEDYHISKTEEAASKGLHLIHIFEDEWVNKNDIVKSRLKNILGVSEKSNVYARNCEIKEISVHEKEVFLESHHIMGNSISPINIGAFYNNELVSIMTFSKGSIAKGNTSKDDVWELNRFCSKINIPGVASKLLKYFQTNYSPKEIFSYADRRWSTGNLYETLGFTLDHITKPNYWYVKGMNRIHRFNLRKTDKDPQNITEQALRVCEGYNIIWDCGNLVYKLTVKKESV